MKRFGAIVLALALVVSLAACSNDTGDTCTDGTTGNTGDTNTNTTDTTVQPEGGSSTNTDDTDGDDNSADTENGDTAAGDEADVLNVGFLKGPTGMGAAYMMQQNENGGTETAYDIIVEADVTNINSGLISGALDIAAVPTNVASVLYNKTNGNIKIAAINTLGVLYILEKGDSVNSVGDLAGKTIYATGQGSNPQYVLEYILRENGLEVGEDVFVEYLASDELATKMASGMIDLCMLPVPAVTTVLVKNAEVRMALSLAEEWENITGGSSVLTQGCIVARSDTVTDEALESFLRDYEKSVTFMVDAANIDAAAELAVNYEIVGAVPVAKKALPDCNLVYVTGEDTMREYLAEYYQILYAFNPDSIGGNVPDDAFYR